MDLEDKHAALVGYHTIMNELIEMMQAESNAMRKLVFTNALRRHKYLVDEKEDFKKSATLIQRSHRRRLGDLAMPKREEGRGRGEESGRSVWS